jgi:DNA invertase Pin-like site-specific DNA recombinase
MKVAIYARVSTDDKSQDSLNQLQELREFAGRQGWTVVREYTDQATAKNGERTGFKEMWADVAKHRFDLLLFWSLDRLTREGTYKTLTYLRRLTDAGVKFKSYTEQYIDSLGVFSDAIIGVLAAVAAQERIRISERTKAGLARTRAQGTRLGRPAAEVNLSRMRRLRARGETMRSIAKKLRVSPALVCKILGQDANGPKSSNDGRTSTRSVGKRNGNALVGGEINDRSSTR